MSDRKSSFGSMNRRRFLGATAGVVAAGLTAGPGSREALAATPQRGGHLTAGIGHGNASDTVDPGLIDNDFLVATVRMLHNHLVELDENGELKGEVAESWEASDDATQWTFELRDGLEFHNGKSVTSEDVVASLRHHMGQDSTSVVAPTLSQITDVQADGTHRIIISLEAANADLPYLVGDEHVPILPAVDGKADALSGIGCGPYSLENFEPGVSLKARRNETYWKSDRAHFDSIELLAIVDGTARTNALITGEVDIIDRVELKTARRLEALDSVRVHSLAGAQHYTFPMMTTFEPFNNVDVRKALKLAVDREELVAKVLRGYGSLGNDHPIGQNVPYFAEGLPQRTYDPDKAKWHIQKSGLGPIKVELSAADAAFTGAVDAALLYQQSAAKAGIDIKVIRETNDGYWTSVWAKKQWCACYWPGNPTIDGMLSQAYLPEAAWNDTQWSESRITDLVKQGRAELDPPKRAEIYYELQELISNEGATVVPMFANYVFATSDKIGHGAFSAARTLDGQKFSERWWFQS